MLDRIYGPLSHAIMWFATREGLIWLGNYAWWVEYVESPAVVWCSENHPDEWEVYVQEEQVAD